MTELLRASEARWLETLGQFPLYEWHDPLALMRALTPPEGVAGYDLHADGRFKKHQEAWVASRFAVGYAQIFGEPTQIKMVPDEEQTPDAMVKVGAREIPLDVTAIYEPGRRFREEYKKKAIEVGRDQEKGTHIRDVRCPQGDEAEKWLADALDEKARTAYPGLWLLVYFNVFGGEDLSRSKTLLKTAASWEQVCILDSRGEVGEYALLFLKGKRRLDWVPFSLHKKLEKEGTG